MDTLDISARLSNVQAPPGLRPTARANAVRNDGIVPLLRLLAQDLRDGLGPSDSLHRMRQNLMVWISCLVDEFVCGLPHTVSGARQPTTFQLARLEATLPSSAPQAKPRPTAITLPRRPLQ